jgi:hypothetical protein
LQVPVEKMESPFSRTIPVEVKGAVSCRRQLQRDLVRQVDFLEVLGIGKPISRRK